MPSKASPAQPSVPKRPSQVEIDSTASLMAQTMDLVRFQMRRIKKDIGQYQETLTREKQDEVTDSCRSLFADVHYMLISLHNVEQLFSRLNKLAPHEVELTNVRNRYRKWLRKCSDFRTSIDVNETRLQSRMIDCGRLEGGQFCLNGLKLDISPLLENEVEAYFRDLATAWATISDRQKRLRELIFKRSELAS